MRAAAKLESRALAAMLAFMLLGCSASADRWTGSVDAVFRYRPSDNSTVVHEVRPGSASEEVGLRAGDRILSVDGEDVTAATYDEVRAALRGPVGTRARVTVERDGEVIDLEVERLPIRGEDE